ncbi:hypothetical protein KL86DYS1_10415 [uncultured Dysgonomonas sp.]|uniref:Uncharacterized protein n=1 Tax=uncultured Dysgonomonas sp. TaxID=206096 RepID=A0A212IX40_9BACT|nr:hypothetical protein KL86DYS1_10415 [uncultured Dysgonomonas sp.]
MSCDSYALKATDKISPVRSGVATNARSLTCWTLYKTLELPSVADLLYPDEINRIGES